MDTCISVIHLPKKIQLDNLCLSSLIPREKTHLSVGQQAHKNCFGRGQGTDGGGQDTQLVPCGLMFGGLTFTCQLKIPTQRKLLPWLSWYEFLRFLKSINLYNCSSHPFLLASYSKRRKSCVHECLCLYGVGRLGPRPGFARPWVWARCGWPGIHEALAATDRAVMKPIIIELCW